MAATTAWPSAPGTSTRATRTSTTPPGPAAQAPRLAELARLDDAAFRERFRGSPVKRIGRGRFVRNVLVAVGNSGDPSFAPLAGELTRDDDPLVRGAAVWAFSRLAAEPAFLAARRDDPDPEVAREWAEGLAELRAREAAMNKRDSENLVEL